MTSKRELRDELQAAVDRNRDVWDEGFAYAMRIFSRNNPAPWAAHLARVAEVARADGYREGYGVALTASQAQPGTGVTPEPDGPSGGEVNRFTDGAPESGCCDFACCCTHVPETWTPGSVVR